MKTHRTYWIEVSVTLITAPWVVETSVQVDPSGDVWIDAVTTVGEAYESEVWSATRLVPPRPATDPVALLAEATLTQR